MPFKMSYTTRNGRLTFDAVLANRYEAWATLAMIQELFEEPACGDCGSDHIRHATRTSKNRDQSQPDYQFYELVCENCGAKLEFGVTNDQKRMWAKRRDKDKNDLPNRGWTRYIPQTQNVNGAPVQDGGDYDPNAYGDPSGFEAPPVNPPGGEIPF